ncbi:MAG: hypothetical protein GY782_02285 [Gammaproteobacteria bacterium]|nr:hypothetical protein [Gammaproteobacteria bacterium]
MEYHAPITDDNGETYIPIKVRGPEILRNPKLNKGSAFSHDERAVLNLTARLPNKVELLEDWSFDKRARTPILLSNVYKNANKGLC